MKRRQIILVIPIVYLVCIGFGIFLIEPPSDNGKIILIMGFIVANLLAAREMIKGLRTKD